MRGRTHATPEIVCGLRGVGLRHMHFVSRTHREGECEASEGSLMCEDFLRSGFQRFIVDPGVRQAYFPETARKLYTDKVTASNAFLWCW